MRTRNESNEKVKEMDRVMCADVSKEILLRFEPPAPGRQFGLGPSDVGFSCGLALYLL